MEQTGLAKKALPMCLCGVLQVSRSDRNAPTAITPLTALT